MNLVQGLTLNFPDFSIHVSFSPRCPQGMDTHIHAVRQGLIGSGKVAEELVGRVIVAVIGQVVVEHAALLHRLPDGLALLQRNPAGNEQQPSAQCDRKQVSITLPHFCSLLVFFPSLPALLDAHLHAGPS